MSGQLTTTRISWLEFLAKHGESSWDRMPRRASKIGRDAGAVTNGTWRPMVAAGLIEARFGQRDFRERPNWLFKITDVGRAALAKAKGEVSP